MTLLNVNTVKDIPMLKQHIYYLNQQENMLLAEMRDAALPELMSGKIETGQDIEQ